MTHTSDLLIIGAGPGGYETAVKATSAGLAVTIVERAEPGGTCLNRGCIPTKALCRAAEVADIARVAHDFGVRATFDGIDLRAVNRRKDEVVEALREGVISLLSPVTLVSGEARFTAPDTVVVAGETYTAPRVIVATGSKPAVIPVKGAENAIDSDAFLRLESLPARATIIGGGVIGLEFARILNSFGVEVNVVEACKEILPGFDREIAKRLRMSMKRRGVNILTDASVTEIGPDHSVLASIKGKDKLILADLVIMAVGRRPVVPPGLAQFVSINQRGAIEVDRQMRARLTVDSAVELCAIGDVNGLCMLAHAAVAQGEVALGLRDSISVIPSVVFTQPECAAVGLTEEQCVEKQIEHTILRATFRANGKAVAMGEPEGLVKIISGEDGKIVGCHITGPHAGDLISEAALAITNGLTVEQLRTTVHPHPTLSEILPSVR